MLDITKSRGDHYNMKKLQMVLNINSLDFEAETNKFDGKLKRCRNCWFADILFLFKLVLR